MTGYPTILSLLTSCFIDDHKDLAARVKTAEHQNLGEQLRILTEMERTPGVRVDLFGLVAAAKVALANGGDEKKFAAFFDRVCRFQGLIQQ